MKPIRVPIRAAEIWTRWLELAAELGLDPGTPADLGKRDPLRLYAPADAARMIDGLVVAARLRTPAFRLATWPDGSPGIVANPNGLDPNLDGLAASLRFAARDLQKARAVAESFATDLPVEAIARRWGIAERTLRAWRAEARKGAEMGPPVAPLAPESCPTMAATQSEAA